MRARSSVGSTGRARPSRPTRRSGPAAVRCGRRLVAQPGNGLGRDATHRRDAPVRALGVRAQDAAGRRPALVEAEGQPVPHVAADELDEGVLGGSVEPVDLEGRQPQPTGGRRRGAARRRPIGPHDAPRSAARRRRARRAWRRAGRRAPPPAVTARPRAHRAAVRRRLRPPVDRASSLASSPSVSPRACENSNRG